MYMQFCPLQLTLSPTNNAVTYLPMLPANSTLLPVFHYPVSNPLTLQTLLEYLNHNYLLQWSYHFTRYIPSRTIRCVPLDMIGV